MPTPFSPFRSIRQTDGEDRPRILARLLHTLEKRIILVLTITFVAGVGAAVWYVSRLTSDLVESTALRDAQLYIEMLAEFRTLYTSEVVSRLEPEGIVVTHDYQATDGAIPLPATLSLLLGERIGQGGSGMGVRLFSDYPFPWRQDGGPRDGFEREALTRLGQRPAEPFYRFDEEYRGKFVLRYATADRMRPGCVSCHNSHPDTPKADWQVGDVRGVLAVVLPLDQARAAIGTRLPGVFILLGTSAGVGLLLLGLVISSLRRHTKDLAVREAKFRTLFHSAPDAMLIVDGKGKIALVNARAQPVFGYAPQELLGQSLEALLPERFRLRYVKERGQYFATPRTRPMGRDLDLWALHKDGREFPVEISLSPLETEEGLLIACAIRDIGDRRQLEAQLLQSQKMEGIGRLAGGISHDFNNILTAILGYSQIALERIDKDKPLWRDLKEIYAAAQRAASLTQQLLAFSRKQTLKMTVVNLNDVMRDLEPMLRRLIREDITVETRLSPDLGAIEADTTQLQQILINLAVNARDAMPDGGRLTIETANKELTLTDAKWPSFVPGRYVMLAVSDTGCGMDKETQAHIFEPFFTTKAQGEGTGLGLATVYGTVKQLRGYIWAYSEPQQGATFKLYFPETAAQGQQQQEQIADSDTVLVGEETVLIVEDDMAVRPFVASVLKRHGYRVYEAATPEEALAISDELNGLIALMITDVVMPGMSGPDLAIRLESKQPQTKVLYMSGYSDSAIVNQGIFEASGGLLDKPFSAADLLRKVRRILDDRGAETS